MKKIGLNFSRFLLFKLSFVSLSPSARVDKVCRCSFVGVWRTKMSRLTVPLWPGKERWIQFGFCRVERWTYLLFDRLGSSVTNARNWNEKSWLVRQWKYLPLQMPCQSTVTNHSSGPSLRPCETHWAMLTPCSWGQRAIWKRLQRNLDIRLTLKFLQEIGTKFVSAKALSFFVMLQFFRPN